LELIIENMPESFDVINPANGERFESFEFYSREKVIEIAERANRMFDGQWRHLSTGQRSDFIRNLARSLRAKKQDYARTMTQEMGKPIVQSENEIEKCAWTAELYSEKAEEWISDEVAESDAKETHVILQPLGVVLSIMPWNFPFWQVIRFAIPALAMGNTSVLRHSNVCPGSALAIEDLFLRSEFPTGAFSAIITKHDAVANLIESDLIRAVSLTGSVGAGRNIAELAGKSLKKCVLELGGSDPFVVLEDANVDQAAKVAAEARLLNSGQSCICAKRFIVVKDVSREFTEKFIREFERKKTGNPLDRSTDVGPLVNQEAVRIIVSQVGESVKAGAKIEIGGRAWDSPGSFYEPTVLTNVTENMRVMKEEVFGPVAPIFVAANEQEAIRTANNSEFGLGASLWTEDRSKAARLSREIESGMVFLNAMVKSDPRIPFGGIKNSGIGRELSKYGLREFANIKTIAVYESPRRESSVAISQTVE
jgi:acyl-CoA reductase-like NAD-dependent aldehyde dehydrogenase